MCHSPGEAIAGAGLVGLLQAATSNSGTRAAHRRASKKTGAAHLDLIFWALFDRIIFDRDQLLRNCTSR
jgi:hypothetical protein